MFGSAKPAASLSSGLLARKGQARPAMRPQGYIGLDPGTSLDDLGWNDMGGEMPAPAPVFEPVPPVLAQRQTLVEEFAPPPLPPHPAPKPVAAPVARAPEPEAPVRPVSTATAARIGREVGARKGKAAFTLRLDHDRHLKLRLASAVTGRSAQVIVTEALDAYLESLPELGALVDRLPAGKAR
jgi:predicted DNA-binding protein